MDPTIVVVVFVVLLAALLYFMYKDHGEKQAVSEPSAEKEATIAKAKEPKAEAAPKEEPAKPGPEPKAETGPEAEPATPEAPVNEAAEEGLESLGGIGEKYRALLQAAGVETVSALAEWDAESLFNKLTEINRSQQIVKRPPPLATVEDWVKRAGERTG